MGKASSSSSATTGINSSGSGNITEGPSLWVIVIIAIVVVFYLGRKK